ncbi:MAG: protein kinase, partial [Coleofasciculaceae cyanobacterium]
MSYCLTPGCFQPQNPDSARFCATCGSKLWLKERYHPLKPIGQGGFGRTFFAVDEDMPAKPPCVIKQLCLQSQSSLLLRKAMQLFHQEAENLEKLGEHPQIPALLAHFEQNKQLYLVQEWIEGETLKQELQQTGPLKENHIWQLLRNLLPVLQFIHENKVIHRDIKPHNIMRRRQDQQPVLIDFGVAKFLTGTALLQTGTVVGTAEYLAPEQTKGKAFPASDLYSLGVTCIHLLTDIAPFDLFDIVDSRWVWRDYLPSNAVVSDRLGCILDNLLENTIRKRYQSAAEVLQELDRQTPSKTADVDYQPLQNFLAAGKWQKADQETGQVMCQVAGKFPGNYLQAS